MERFSQLVDLKWSISCYMRTSEISSSEVRLSEGNVDENAIALKYTTSLCETRRYEDMKELTVLLEILLLCSLWLLALVDPVKQRIFSVRCMLLWWLNIPRRRLKTSSLHPLFLGPESVRFRKTGTKIHYVPLSMATSKDEVSRPSRVRTSFTSPIKGLMCFQWVLRK